MSFFVNVVVETSLTLYLIKKSSCNCAPEGLDYVRKRCMSGVKDNLSIKNILQDLNLPRIMLAFTVNLMVAFSNPQVTIYNLYPQLANHQP